MASFLYNLFVLLPFFAVGTWILCFYGNSNKSKNLPDDNKHELQPEHEHENENLNINEQFIFVEDNNTDEEIDDDSTDEYEIDIDDEDDDFENININNVNNVNNRNLRKRNQIIGKKKARSLELKAERQAYGEFLRLQSAQRKAEEKAYLREHSEEIKDKLLKRQLINDLIKEKNELKRKEIKKKNDDDLQLFINTSNKISNLEQGVPLLLKSDIDYSIASSINNSINSNVSSNTNECQKSIITKSNYFIKFSNSHLEKIYDIVNQRGNLSPAELSKIFNDVCV